MPLAPSWMDGGAALKLLLREVAATASAAGSVPALTEHAIALSHCAASVAKTTGVLGAAMARGEVRLALSNASRYLGLVGHLAIAWSWLRQALVATRAEPATPAEADFYAGKLAACRWFFVHELPATELDARLLAALDATALDTRPEVL